MNNEKIVNINVKLKNLFSQWIRFTEPFHNLSNRHQKVLSLLLYYHFQLQKEITNNRILWKEVFDYDTKVKIYTEIGIQSGALENILSQLRNKKVIIDNQISPVYIPNLSRNAKKFSITFNFNIVDEKQD